MAATDLIPIEPRRISIPLARPLWLMLVIAVTASVFIYATRSVRVRSPSKADAASFTTKSPAARHEDAVIVTAPAVSRPAIWSNDGEQIWSLQISPNDRYLVAHVYSKGGLNIRRVLVIEMETSKVVVEAPAHFRALSCFVPASNAVAIYTTGPDALASASAGTVAMYGFDGRTKKGEIEITPPGGWQLVRAIGISQDGRILVALLHSTSPASRRAWDIETQDPVPFEPGKYFWTGDGLSPDGALCSMGGWPGPGVRIRRFDSGEPVSFCLRDTIPAVGSSFSDDGRLWATIYNDGMFVAWDIRENVDKIGRGLLKKDGFKNCTAFAMSHDLKRIVYAENDGSIRKMPLELPPSE
jgi:WD40 repeat protein